MLLRFLKPLVIIGCTIGSTAAFAADDASQQPQAAPQQTAPTPSGGAASGKTPKATAESTEKGQLKNPYQDFAKVADEATRNSWPRAAMAATAAVAAAAWATLDQSGLDLRQGRRHAVPDCGTRQRRTESPRLRPQRLGERRWTDARNGRDREDRRRHVEDHRLDSLGQSVLGFGERKSPPPAE